MAIVTIFAENTSRREIILISLRMLRAIKIIPDGRAGRNGLIFGILYEWDGLSFVKLRGGGWVSYCKAQSVAMIRYK